MGLVESLILTFILGASSAVVGIMVWEEPQVVEKEIIVPQKEVQIVKTNECEYQKINITVKDSNEATDVVVGAVGDSIKRANRLNVMEKSLNDREKDIERREKLVRLKEQALEVEQEE